MSEPTWQTFWDTIFPIQRVIEDVRDLSRKLATQLTDDASEFAEARPLAPAADAPDRDFEAHQARLDDIGSECQKLQVTYPSIFARGAIVVICSLAEQALSRLGPELNTVNGPKVLKVAAGLVGTDFLEDERCKNFHAVCIVRNYIVHVFKTKNYLEEARILERDFGSKLRRYDWIAPLEFSDAAVQRAAAVTDQFLQALLDKYRVRHSS